MNKVSKNLELRRALASALNAGRYLITITHVKGHKLEHYLTYQKFPDEDLLPTFDHFAGKILADETENYIKAPAESGGHSDDDEGSSGSEADVLRLDDRREDTVSRDLGEQPEPDES
jgi:hypothetical protein